MNGLSDPCIYWVASMAYSESPRLRLKLLVSYKPLAS